MWLEKKMKADLKSVWKTGLEKCIVVSDDYKKKFCWPVLSEVSILRETVLFFLSKEKEIQKRKRKSDHLQGEFSQWQPAPKHQYNCAAGSQSGTYINI